MTETRYDEWLGVWTLYVREVRRFAKVYNQTVLAPVATTLIFLAIFALAVDGSTAQVDRARFVDFLAPGLIMMAIAQNAFANTSSSIIIAKVQGNIVDTLMPPLSADELTLGIALGGVTRGLVVGLAVGLAMLPFVAIRVHDFALLIYFAVTASLMLSLLGIIGGVWAEKFDQVAVVTNFIIMPLSFLSGTFYPVSRLPTTLQYVAHADPFFYMIDGFRYACIGQSGMPVTIGVGVMAVINAGLWLLCRRMFATGFRLKA
jgi:ABC-2 type transport system permease protein